MDPIALTTFPKRLIMIRPQGGVLARMLHISTMVAIAAYVKLPLHVYWDTCPAMPVGSLKALFDSIPGRVVLVTAGTWNKLRTQFRSVFLENAAKGLVTGEHRKASNITVLRTLFNPNMVMRYSSLGSYDLYHLHPDLCTSFIPSFAAQRNGAINSFVPVADVRRVVHDEALHHASESGGESGLALHRGVYYSVDSADTVNREMVALCLKRGLGHSSAEAMTEDDGCGLVVATPCSSVAALVGECLPNCHMLPCHHKDQSGVGQVLQTLAHVYSMRILCGAALVRCVHSNPNTTTEDQYLQTFFHAKLTMTDLHAPEWKDTLSASAGPGAYTPDPDRWDTWKPVKVNTPDVATEEPVTQTASPSGQTVAKPVPKANTVPDAKPKSEPEHVPDAKPKSEPEPKAEPEPEPDHEAESESAVSTCDIIAGIHKGKVGLLVKQTEKFVTVKIEGVGSDVRVAKHNVTMS